MTRAAGWVFVLVVGLASGCSRAPTIPGAAEYDSAAAKRTLTDTLEAWKTGKVGTLAARTPPVRFVDDDLVTGWQLVGYELADPAARIRPTEPIAVKLKLRDRKGKVVERTANYQVTLHPSLAVIRSD